MGSRQGRVINLPVCVSGSAAAKSLRGYQSNRGVHCNLCSCECVRELETVAAKTRDHCFEKPPKHHLGFYVCVSGHLLAFGYVDKAAHAAEHFFLMSRLCTEDNSVRAKGVL